MTAHRSSAFAGYRFPPEVISVAVRWYLRYGLSGTVALRALLH
jgi:transposase-like protein